MKTLILLALITFTQLSISANIKGLDANEKADATKCLKSLFGLDFDRVNRIPKDNYQFYHKPAVERVLMHNFVDQTSHKEYQINNSIIMSGSLIILEDQKVKLTNTVIANATIAGDISNVDFSGSCLINVSLPTKTSWLQMRKIRKQANFVDRIEFNDDIYKNY